MTYFWFPQFFPLSILCWNDVAFTVAIHIIFYIYKYIFMFDLTHLNSGDLHRYIFRICVATRAVSWMYYYNYNDICIPFSVALAASVRRLNCWGIYDVAVRHCLRRSHCCHHLSTWNSRTFFVRVWCKWMMSLSLCHSVRPIN